MIIKGANLGNAEGEFKDLSKHDLVDGDYLKDRIRMLERLYYNLYEKAKDSEVTPMSIDENNQVIIKPYMVNHRCSSDLNNLKLISEYGVLASEWFGLLESEREGCFCVFVSRMKGENYPPIGSLAEDDYSRLNIGNDVILFFDDTNPLMEYLLHLDYFEFEYQKQNNPNYRSLYTPSELEILEELIEPLSPAGKYMRKPFNTKTNYWSAIPGGIPSFLVNGICVKNNNYSENELDEISTLFPNAVIFDASKKVLRNKDIDMETSKGPRL